MVYVLRRLGHTAVVLLGVSIVVFALIQLVPGDPVRLALGTRFSQESYDALRAASGLDQPLPVQFFGFIGGALTGDLGVSFRSGQPVAGILLDRLPATLSLAFAGIVVAVIIAFPLGIIAALRNGKATDAVVRVVSQAGVSLPDFWMALLLILGLSAGAKLLPSSGYVPITDDPVEWARHVAIPAITVGLIAGSIMTRYVRSSVLEVMGADHVRTARSKGLRDRIVLGRHVVRNALVPVITVGGVQLATMLGGVVVVEVVVGWPGLGRLVFDSVNQRDYPVIQGAVLLIAMMFLLINLIVDLLYARIDPRIRLS